MSNGVSIRLYSRDFSQLIDEFELTAIRNPFIATTAINWSPDGTMIGVMLQGSDISPILQIWNVQERKIITEILHISASATFSWGAHSRQIAVIHEQGLGDVKIRIYDVPDVNTFAEFEIDDRLGYINHIQWSPDGNQIAVNKGGALYLLDVQSGRSHTANVSMFASFESPRFVFSPDSRYLIGVETPDATSATILDVSKDEIVALLHGHRDRILSLGWFDQYIVTVSLDGFTRLWSVTTFEEIAAFQTGITSAPSFSPDGHAFVASANDDKTLVVRDSETGQVIASFDQIEIPTPTPISSITPSTS